MITWANVVNLAPELATVPAGAQAQILQLAYQEMDSTTWGDLLDSGATWLAAHLATLTLRKGKAGALESARVGPVEQSWGSLGTERSLLDATVYGQSYLRMIRQNPRFRFAGGRRRARYGIWSSVAAWQPSTVYAVGNLAKSNGNIYACAQVVGAGESSAAPGGPIGIGINIPDFQTPQTNGLFWAFIGSAGA